jgi:hypothetical protein
MQSLSPMFVLQDLTDISWAGSVSIVMLHMSRRGAAQAIG